MSANLYKLRQRIYTQTLRDLKPLEGIKAHEINEILYNRTRVIDDDLVVVSNDGTPTGQSYDDFVKTIKTARPDCFEPEASDNSTYKTNPFSKSHFNLTAQMIMIRSNPEEAARLEAEAKKNNKEVSK